MLQAGALFILHPFSQYETNCAACPREMNVVELLWYRAFAILLAKMKFHITARISQVTGLKLSLSAAYPKLIVDWEPKGNGNKILEVTVSHTKRKLI